MDIDNFLKTLYLGDRYCKSLLIEGYASRVKIQADIISRIRGDVWNNYNDEDIEDGYIVFEGVESLQLTSAGLLPNDAFDAFYVDVVDEYGLSEVVFLINAISQSKIDGQEPLNDIVEIRFRARSVFLEDPKHHGRQIRA